MILAALTLAEDPVSLGVSLRAQGNAADERRDWPAALDAWQACAASAPDRDARYCRVRAEALAPYAADQYAGWDVLEGVRRDYRTIGTDEAIARIQRALYSLPGSPAVPAMRLWLQNEHSRRGDRESAEKVAVEIVADPRSSPADRAFVVDRGAMVRADANRRVAGLACAGVASACGLAAALGRGPLLWRSSALAVAFVAAPPAVLAWAYDHTLAPGFVWSGLVVAGWVLLCGRTSAIVATTGTVAALGAVAWANDWFPSIGL